jgi:hypothetical protein
MSKQRKPPGKVVDELITNPRRIWLAHAGLGIVSAFVYWLVPGTFSPHIHRPHKGDGAIVIVQTLIAWAPYLLSGFYTTAVLSPRDSKATLTYIALATSIAIVSALMYFNVFGLTELPSPLLVSAGVTILLFAAASLCAAIWRSDISA